MKQDDDIIITNTAQTFERSMCGEDRERKSGDVLILAIESSCDETAAAVVKNGRTVMSNVISSQIALHTVYGGVVSLKQRQSLSQDIFLWWECIILKGIFLLTL